MNLWKYSNIEEHTEEFKDKNENVWKYSTCKLADIEESTIVGILDISQKEDKIGSLEYDSNRIKISEYKKPGILQKVKGVIKVEDDGVVSNIIVVKSRKAFLLKLLLLLILLVGLVCSICFFINKDKGPVYDDNAISYKMPDGVEVNADKDHIAIPGFNTLVYEQKRGEMYVALANPEGNPCDFVYQVVLDETGETLYQSGRIKPGTAVTKEKINKKLTLGTHAITIKIKAFDLDNPDIEVNGGEIETKLIVK